MSADNSYSPPSSSKAAASRRHRTNSVRELIVSITFGLLVLVFVLYGITTMTKRVEPRTANGVVVGKEILPRSETQFTLGADGFSKKEVSGEYVLRVRVPEEDRVYRVWVTKSVFDATEVGSPYMLLKQRPSAVNDQNARPSNAGAEESRAEPEDQATEAPASEETP